MKFPALLAASCLMISCSTPGQTSSHPQSPDDRTSLDAPVPSPAMARRHSASWESISLGHAVYMRKCGECHEHLLPDEVASEDWSDHVTEMAQKSGISPEDNPLSPPSDPVQRRLQSPPAKSNFLAVQGKSPPTNATACRRM
jgi:hypothetical protein